jgi:hypothetical protein
VRLRLRRPAAQRLECQGFLVIATIYHDDERIASDDLLQASETPQMDSVASHTASNWIRRLAA